MDHNDPGREPKVIVESNQNRIVRHYPPDELYPTYTFEMKLPNTMNREMHFVEVGSWSMKPEDKLPSQFTVTGDLFIEMIRLIDGDAIPPGGASFMPFMPNNNLSGEQVIQ